MTEVKTCRVCKEVLDISKFHIVYYKRDNKYRHTNVCKECNKDICKNRRQSVNGMFQDIYNGQILSSKHRKHVLPNYTLEELITWMKQQTNYTDLINNWINSNFDKFKKPSCDRLNNDIPYTLHNLRLVTFKENCLQANKDIKNNDLHVNQRKVIQYNKSMEFVAKYNSIAEACRATGCAPGNLVKCCQGEYKTSKNFIWKYLDD